MQEQTNKQFSCRRGIVLKYGIFYVTYPIQCTLGIFPAPAFAADFPPVAPEFYQRTHRVRLKNLGTTDKKSSRKIKYKKTPRVHYSRKGSSMYDKHSVGNFVHFVSITGRLEALFERTQ